MTSFERDGKVSIWMFRKAADPDDDAKDVLKDLCGVDYYDSDFQEGIDCKEPSTVKSLLSKLSYSESFIAPVLNAANELNIKEAFGVIAQFNFEYDPGKVERPLSDDPVFVGAFDWQE